MWFLIQQPFNDFLYEFSDFSLIGHKSIFFRLLGGSSWSIGIHGYLGLVSSFFFECKNFEFTEYGIREFSHIFEDLDQNLME